MFGVTLFKKALRQDSRSYRGEVLSRIEAYRVNTAPEKTLAEAMESDQHEGPGFKRTREAPYEQPWELR